jgi:PncC family amidohydrolase
MLGYFWGPKPTIYDKNDVTVSVAESVTAGAVCNSLCAEPGASSYFKGGVTAYSIASKKEILGIDTKYAEQNNFANPFTTVEMAKAVTKMFKSRFGIATTGYSLPFYRPENKEKGECELKIDTPYAFICLYDAATGEEVTIREDYNYNVCGSKELQRANMQARIAILATKMYKERVKKILTPDAQ